MSVLNIWKNQYPQQLAQVLASIEDEATMRAFLRDVLTEKEIIEISARLQAARMLQAGATYASITSATKLSSRTVARISDWLQNGAGGYKTALKVIGTHPAHIPPASAE